MQSPRLLLAILLVTNTASAQLPPTQPPPPPVAALPAMVIKQPGEQAVPKYLLGVIPTFQEDGLLVEGWLGDSPLQAMTIPGVKNVYSVERGDVVVAIRNGLGQFVMPQSKKILSEIVNTLPAPQTTIFVKCTRCKQLHVYDVTLAENKEWNGKKLPRDNPKLVVVLIGDTGDKSIGKYVKESLDGVEALIDGETQKRHLRGKVIRVDGKNCTRDGILNALNRAEVMPGDTLLCFINCHGAHDSSISDYANGHFFHMADGERLYRDRLKWALVQKGADLTCLLSDSCNPNLSVTGTETAYTDAKRNEKFESLFFGPKGVLDINSSAEGQYAWCNNFGPAFTNSLSLKAGSQKTTWGEYTKELDETVQKNFVQIKKVWLEHEPKDKHQIETQSSIRKQDKQTIRVYSLPK